MIAIGTFGDFLGLNSRWHAVVANSCFCGNGMFRVVPLFEAKDLEVIFEHKLLKMLLSKRKIPEDLVSRLLSWCQRKASIAIKTVEIEAIIVASAVSPTPGPM